MKTMITEFVEIRSLETTTDEQFLAKAEVLNDFLKMQDGYVDAELLKGIEGNIWRFIFHFESMEKVKSIGEKMRNSKEFDDFKTLIVPGSIVVTFYRRERKW